MAWSGEPVRVRVPATSANLGPGFDAIGLALGLYDDVEACIVAEGLSIEVTGEGAELAETGENHLVVRAMRAAFEELGEQPPGLALRCANRIPHGRGLGSSAAAIVAGVVAARALVDAAGAAGAEDPAGPDAALALASRLEGHPDNVAAALLGGLTIAWESASGARAVRLEPAEPIKPVAIIAESPVRTEVARGLLPDQVPHADAAFNSGRSALLVAALTTYPETLLDATADRLHQDYRAKAMPATFDLVTRLRAAGVPAVVSGAGPSVLAFTSALGLLTGIVDSTGEETGTAWSISPLDVARFGASIISASPTRGSDRDAGTCSPGR
jgi:homoserine kinase